MWLHMNCFMGYYVVRGQQLLFAQMTSCAMRYDVIYYPFPINSQYYIWSCGGLTALTMTRAFNGVKTRLRWWSPPTVWLYIRELEQDKCKRCLFANRPSFSELFDDISLMYVEREKIMRVCGRSRLPVPRKCMIVWFPHGVDRYVIVWLNCGFAKIFCASH